MHRKDRMKRLVWLALTALLTFPGNASAFCGFYVAKADTKLFNKASKVVLVRDENKTVITMASDYQGDPQEFALVVPVPTFLEKGQIHVAEPAVVDHLDAYSAPRLVEYFDEDPCAPQIMYERMAGAPMGAAVKASDMQRAKKLGVTIEAQYTVGEYDILILSAEESSGLETWLKENGYKIPEGATDVLGSYIKQKMRFFVAKVNLQEQSKLGFSYLRPIQVAFESPKFMLPIRLGTVNANGDQEMFVFTLTKKGRVESTNYRTVKLPSGMDIPLYVKDTFADFYKAMFTEQLKKESSTAVFLEYAWDMGWCDPCAAEPLSPDELKQLGVFWLDEQPTNTGAPVPFFRGSGAVPVFVTRLHLRYNKNTFPEDLTFQETSNRENFQGRYVLRHPWKGSASCTAADTYRRELPRRQEKEAQTLASLTGWDVNDVRKKMDLAVPAQGTGKDRWWEKIW